MVVHQNPSLSERAQRILNTKVANNLSDDVSGPVAIIPIVPVCRIVKAGTAAGTIYTTPAGKDFYLVAALLSEAKVVGDAGVSASLTVVIDGLTINLLTIAGVTLTADAQTVSISFPLPIKLDRSSVIAATGASISTLRSMIVGYTEEVTAS